MDSLTLHLEFTHVIYIYWRGEIGNGSAPSKGRELDLAAPDSNALFLMK